MLNPWDRVTFKDATGTQALELLRDPIAERYKHFCLVNEGGIGLRYFKSMSATGNPLAEADAMISEIIASTPPVKRRGTLLIVDDEEGPRMSLRVIFKDNYDLLMAEDGPTAIELAQKHDIDVAILDIRMAGMSGIEVLERLRYVKADIEAIMITAFETTDTIRQALRLRACDYINKPFDIATIRNAVNGAMQRRMLEGEIHTSAEKVHELLGGAAKPKGGGADRQDARRHLREHHPRHQRAVDGGIQVSSNC